jgi:NAD(P)-dependent dehydrogenase (short-subunit alcohol dehydrogenase family)
MSVNVRGPYLCIRAVIPLMIGNGGGSILNLASVASNLGIPDRFAYSTSKGAVYTMTLSVARDFIEKGIRCNCLCPARVHTPFVDNYLKENYPGKEEEMFSQLEATQPIGRMAKPSEIASLATYICSEEASFVTGSAFDIDGGFTLLK